jgi:hypothetical protein
MDKFQDQLPDRNEHNARSERLPRHGRDLFGEAICITISRMARAMRQP